MAADDETLYVANSDVRLSVVAPGTAGSQPSVFSPKTAFLLDDKAGGGLIALGLENGEKRWFAPPAGCAGVAGCSPAQSAAVTAIAGVVFSGAMDGHMRAYSAGEGRVLWDVDTKQDFKTTNEVAAKGGSIDGGGAVVVDGFVYIASGGAIFGGAPGNVLLAYSLDGR